MLRLVTGLGGMFAVGTGLFLLVFGAAQERASSDLDVLAIRAVPAVRGLRNILGGWCGL